MDFRLPGHRRRRDHARARRRVSGGRGRLPHRLGEPARARRASRGRRGRLPAQGPGARRDRRRHPPRRASRGACWMNLTTDNTAIVLDSTADFPDAQIRFPNMRVVPLYVRFGDESFRDYVELDPHDFYERLRPPRAADDVAADAAGLPLRLPRAGRLRADLLAPHLRRLSGTFESARSPRRTTATGSASSTRSRRPSGSRCSRSRSSSCSSAARPTRRSRRSSRAIATSAGCSSRSTRSSSSPRAVASAARRRWPGSLLNVKPILTIADGEVVPLKRVRGRRRRSRSSAAFEEATTDGPGPASASRTPKRRTRPRSCARSCSPRPQAEVKLVTTLGAVVGTHAGPGTVGFFWFQD